MSSYLAKKAAQQKASALLEPLLSDDESSDDETEEENVEIEKQTPLQKLKTVAVYVILGAGVAVSAAAMVFSPQTLVFVAGGICCANVPYSAYKENALSKIPTLRSLNNALRQDANRLAEEVDTLSEEIDLLEPEADRAAAVEEELREIAERQQCNVDKLVDLVKENGQILDQMKDNLRHRIVQDVIHIVISSDRDGDSSISRHEAKTLSLKIRIQLESYGVEFDSEKFLKVIGMNPTVASVISIVQKLMPSEKDEEKDDDEDLDDGDYDMFHIVEDDHGSISVTSEDIIGTSLKFGGDSTSPAGGTRKRKSLVADAKNSSRRKSLVADAKSSSRMMRRPSRSKALDGSLTARKDAKQHRDGRRK